MTMTTKPDKPLGKPAYGSIPHLPASRRGPGDCGISPGQAKIATLKPRDRHDRIIVQEKLDGTCVAAAKINGNIVPLIRAGYDAWHSHYEQHRMFAQWCANRQADFDALLTEGERACGEWLAQAHGTRYNLAGREPFVLFDIMRGTERTPHDVIERLVGYTFARPPLLHDGGPLSIEKALESVLPFGLYGADDEVEGCVWRVERKGVVDFLCKYVRPDKVDGIYLPTISGGDPVWNWSPAWSDYPSC